MLSVPWKESEPVFGVRTVDDERAIRLERTVTPERAEVSVSTVTHERAVQGESASQMSEPCGTRVPKRQSEPSH